MKKAAISLVAVLSALFCISAQAQAPRVRYGLEWGISPTFLQSRDINYISAEGYRVDEDWTGLEFDVNGLVMAEFGVNLNDCFALSLYAGYAGISKDNRLFPLLLRLSAFPKGMTDDGIFIFADGGAGFHSAIPDAATLPAAVIADAGTGYHIALNRSIGLDFQVSLRGSFDHMLIKDADTGNWVPDADVRRNATRCYALCFSIGLNF